MGLGRHVALALLALASSAGCAGDADSPAPVLGLAREAITCSGACGGTLGSAALPGPGGAVTLIAWSNSPDLATVSDCDPTPCADSTITATAQNGQLAYGCPWQSTELVNRYFQGAWSAPRIQGNAGAAFCQSAASGSNPEYAVYGQTGASPAGFAPLVGDALVWSDHVALATTSVASGASGSIDILEQNATCTGSDSVAWDGSMFSSLYGQDAVCWVHLVANQGVPGPTCATGANWDKAGAYCWDQPGMTHTAPATLYRCDSAGAPAVALQVCPLGCEHMPLGIDDRCQLPADGSPCAVGSDCESGICVSGVCCDSACGACGSCATGTCARLPAGNEGSPSCSPFACDGMGVTCPTSCETDSDCAGGFSCVDSACILGSAASDAGAMADGGSGPAQRGCGCSATAGAPGPVALLAIWLLAKRRR
jgi:hypothetical protein